jgi:SAM-dependent methyltransferase
VSAGHPIHREAAIGFGRSADVYERARPSYPPEAVALLVRELAIEPGSTIVDLAAGTGKLTRLLLPTGAHVVAVEPVAAMRERLEEAARGVTVVEGTAERMPLDDATARAVLVAQAFHWFDPTRATTEIARVLEPGGGLGLLWNDRDESVPWVQQLTRIMEPYRGDTPTHRTRSWRGPLQATGLFEPLDERSFRHEQSMTPDQVVDRVLSVSFIATLPPDERAAVGDAVLTMLEADRGTNGRETLTLPYRTDVFWTKRR